MLAMVEVPYREVRFRLASTEHDVDAIARRLGYPVTDDEAATILDHIDREITSIARSATARAVDARIADLVQMVRSAHMSPDTYASDRIEAYRRSNW